MKPPPGKPRRDHAGPALLSVGFRPFFLLGALFSALSMAGWLWVLAGAAPPAAFDPISWHAHEFIFGYGAAIVCGFLLTAVPNWTGRLPISGLPLAALALIWVIGRLAVNFGAALPPLAVALADLSFLAALAGLIGREIVAGRNWRNLPVLALVLVLLIGNAGFHRAAAAGGFAAESAGARAGIAALVMLLALIGGRIVPSFTRNWLARRGPGPLPVPPGRFDALTLAVTVLALAGWLALPGAPAAGAALIAAGALNAVRLARWAGWRTLAEPLVTVLHLGYLFIPAGFLLTGAAAIWPLNPVAGLHAWLAGAVGLMTLAMMTRASLGHSGRPLTAGAAEIAVYGLALAAALLRIAAALAGAPALTLAAGAAWIAAFALYAIAYWPILTRPRAGPRVRTH